MVVAGTLALVKSGLNVSIVQPSASPSGLNQSSLPEPVEIKEFGLEIEKISIRVPIIADVDGANEPVYQKITSQLGVAHLKGSQKPDQLGNMYIFGHSSYFKNFPGKPELKEIFKSIDKLDKGDRFIVYYKNVAYQYEVFGKKVVASDDFSVLDPTPKDPKDKTITLQTSWPPGTLVKRYIVFARQTGQSAASPSPSPAS